MAGKSTHHPVDKFCLRREVDADFEHRAWIALKRTGITLIFYLLQSLCSSLINFQLQNVDILRRLYQYIHTTVGRMPFHIDIEAQETEEYVESVLEIFLSLAHHLIVTRGEEVLKAADEILGMTTFNVLYELSNRESIPLTLGV